MLIGNPESLHYLKTMKPYGPNFLWKSPPYGKKRKIGLVGVFGNPRSATTLGAFASLQIDKAFLRGITFTSLMIFMNCFKKSSYLAKSRQFIVQFTKPPVYASSWLQTAMTNLGFGLILVSNKAYILSRYYDLWPRAASIKEFNFFQKKLE